MVVNAKMVTSALYKSETTLQHCDFVLLSKHYVKISCRFSKVEDAQGPFVSLEIRISIFNKLNIYSYLWDSKIKNISKLEIVTNEIIKNYICEKQVSITKECIWHTKLKLNVQSINYTNKLHFTLLLLSSLHHSGSNN